MPIFFKIHVMITNIIHTLIITVPDWGRQSLNNLSLSLYIYIYIYIYKNVVCYINEERELNIGDRSYIR